MERKEIDDIRKYIDNGVGFTLSVKKARKLLDYIDFLERDTRLGRPKGPPDKYRPRGLRAELGYLVEECGEVMAAVGKTLRWGTQSVNPELPHEQQETNREWILRELGDLRAAIEIAEAGLDRGDIEHPDDMKVVG